MAPGSAARPESRGSLLALGLCLTIGFACGMAAAFHPALSSVWPTSSASAVMLIGDGRTGAWQLANWLFAIGIWSTLAGLAMLVVLLARRSRTPELPWLLVARWTGWFAAGCGVLLVAGSALSGDVVPALLYLAPLPIAVAALVQVTRRVDWQSLVAGS